MASGPSWEAEQAAWAAGHAVVAGCDEAGRGPLAGPVVAAAVVLRPDTAVPGLNDSKRLDAAQREAACRVVCDLAVAVGVGVAGVDEIDRLNILRASMLAMHRAVHDLGCPVDLVLVDGNRTIPELCLPQRALVGGDGRSVSIAAASVVAKVTRDAMMAELDLTHPGYGFASHKGYTSPEHLEALRRLGPCGCHRTSFAPVRALLPNPPPLPPARCRGAHPDQLRLFENDHGS